METGRFGSLDFEPPRPEEEEEGRKEGAARPEQPQRVADRPPAPPGSVEARPLEVEVEGPRPGEALWEAEVMGTVSSLLYILGTGLFVGAGGPGRMGTLRLLDPETGKAKWALDLHSPASALAFGSGEVYIRSLRDEGPGEGLRRWLRWLAQLEGWGMMDAVEGEPSPPPDSPPTRRLDLVVAGTLDCNAWFVGAHGETLFIAGLDSEPTSIVPEKQVFYIGTERGSVYAFNPYEPSLMERPLWRSRPCDRCVGLALSEDGLFVAGREGNRGVLCSLDLAEGGILWKARLDSPPLSVEGGGRRVYVGTLRGTVYAFDSLFGEAVWTASIGGPAGQIALAGERVLVGTEDGLLALDAAAGEPAWEVDLDGAATALKPEGSKVVALSRRWGVPDSLLCLSLNDGRRLWKVELDSEAPALDAGGGLAFVGLQGKVRAFGI